MTITTELKTCEQRFVTRSTFRKSMCCDASYLNSLIDFWDDPDNWVESGAPLKRGNRCTVSKVEHLEHPLVLKRYNLRGRLHTIAHSLATSRAAKAWKVTLQLQALGFRTPKVIATLEETFGLFRQRSYLLTEYLPAVMLYDYLLEHQHSPKIIHRMAELWGELWQQLAAHRCTHGDMKAINFLVMDEELWMIDLDATIFHRDTRSFAKARTKDRARFLRDFLTYPQIANVFADQMN